MEIAREIASLNDALKAQGKRYLLIGPGRWGTSDKWLGIPVKWNNITQALTIIETTSEKLNADPSQGSHFFHNITTLGINYMGIPPKGENRISLDWLEERQANMQTHYLRYVELEAPALLKIDGKTSRGIILFPEGKGR